MANLLKRHEFWLGMFIIALCLLLGWRSEEFFTFGNLYDLANNYAMLTILACGLFVVLIAGGIDISFPAMTIIAQYGMVVMLQKVGGNFAVAFVLAGGIGVLLGLVNALLVNRLRVPSIIITISTLNIFYGLLLWLSKVSGSTTSLRGLKRGYAVQIYRCRWLRLRPGAAAADDDRRGAVDRVYHEFHYRWPQDLCHGRQPGIRQPRRLQRAPPAAVRLWLYGANVGGRRCRAGVDSDDRCAGFTAGL